MVFGKCVPHSIEGLMMGLVNSIVKLNSDIIMRLFSLMLIYNQSITIENYIGLPAGIREGLWIMALGPLGL
jgi:hypothetical protein